MESTDSSSSSQQPQLPPGFRFHPTDEELVVHYLKKKATSAPLPVTIIAEVDLYKFDPWELPAKASFGEQEWYFFSPRDRKYPNGARPNRAATSGYWKATGTDKPILTSGGTQKVGVKKALVFYGGKPPKGIKTNWIMHEYRLADGSPSSSSRPHTADIIGTSKKSSLRLDDWVLCRIYKKNSNNSNNSVRPMDRERELSLDDVLLAQTPPVTPQAAISAQPRPQPQRAPTSFTALLDNDEHFFQGLLTTEDAMVANPMAQLASTAAKPKLDLSTAPAGCNPTLPLKRALAAAPCWSDASAGTITRLAPQAKRLHGCHGNGSSNSTGSNSSANTTTANNSGSGPAIVTLLNQLPQGPAAAYPQPAAAINLGSMGDGSTIYRLPYQLSSMNWST